MMASDVVSSEDTLAASSSAVRTTCILKSQQQHQHLAGPTGGKRVCAAMPSLWSIITSQRHDVT